MPKLKRLKKKHCRSMAMEDVMRTTPTYRSEEKLPFRRSARGVPASPFPERTPEEQAQVRELQQQREVEELPAEKLRKGAQGTPPAMDTQA